MRLPVHLMDVRLSLKEDLVIVGVIPNPATSYPPHCEVFEYGAIPCDVSAWITLMESKDNGHTDRQGS